MMKRIFNNLFSRFDNLVWNSTKFRYYAISFMIFMILIMYFFNLDLYFFKIFISFLIFNLIFSKFTYSDNFILRVLQKIFIYYVSFYLCIYVIGGLKVFNIIHCDEDEDDDEDDEDSDNESEDNNKISSEENTEDKNNTSNKANNTNNKDESSKEDVDSDKPRREKSKFEYIVDSAVKIYEEMSDDASAIAAGGGAASALIKSIPNASISTKAIGGTAVSIGVTAGVKIGVHVGNKCIENDSMTKAIESLDESVKTHPYAEPTPDRIPSPDQNWINSPLENDSIALIDILGDLISLNILEIFLLLCILLLLIIKNNLNKGSLNKMIWKVITKFVPKIYQDKINNIIKTGKEYNNKINNIIIYVLILIIILLILGNLITCNELYNNIDKYVLVYNYQINKKLLFLICVNKNL